MPKTATKKTDAPGTLPTAVAQRLGPLAALPIDVARRCVTVGQLIRTLKGLNPDAVVVLQHDPEGNGYGPLDVKGVSVDIARLTMQGSSFDLESADVPETELEKPGSENVVVLVPMG